MMKRTVLLYIIFYSIIFDIHAENKKIAIWDGSSIKSNCITLETFLPNNTSNTTPAVIVCPGGSYSWHSYETEGTEVAKWLNSNGIAAFVLKYRVQGVFFYITHMRLIFHGHQHPEMLQDGQRAIQYIREHAKEFNIDANKLGVMGFSAGGHLAMSLCEYHKTDFLKPLGITTHVSLRPDFVALIYPVVTLSNKVAHKRSRRALLGEYKKNNKAMRDSLSLEKHVSADNPPVFLVNCKDDPVVRYQNSELLDSALTSNNVNHLYIQYKTGGHGFGASSTKGTAECRQWRTEFINWLQKKSVL